MAGEPGLRAVGGVAERDPEAAVARYRPVCAVVGYEALDGPAHVRRLTRERPETALVIVSRDASAGQLNHLRHAGARAAVRTDILAPELLVLLRTISEQPLQAAPRVAATSGGLVRLTPRERQVLELLEADCALADVARSLQIGFETARAHAHNLYRKLGVTGRRELAGHLPRSG
jgi:DNA-binding NarL/FixJ family response regulator